MPSGASSTPGCHIVNKMKTVRKNIITAPLLWTGKEAQFLRKRVSCPRSHKKVTQNQYQNFIFFLPSPEFSLLWEKSSPLHTHLKSFPAKVGHSTQKLNPSEQLLLPNLTQNDFLLPPALFLDHAQAGS